MGTRNVRAWETPSTTPQVSGRAFRDPLLRDPLGAEALEHRALARCARELPGLGVDAHGSAMGSNVEGAFAAAVFDRPRRPMSQRFNSRETISPEMRISLSVQHLDRFNRPVHRCGQNTSGGAGRGSNPDGLGIH